MKRFFLLIVGLLFSCQAFSIDIQCEVYGICPFACDKFAKDNPGLKNYFNDGGICVTMQKYGPKLVGKINFTTDIPDSGDVYVDLKDGTKLLMTSARKFFYLKREKERKVENLGFEIKHMNGFHRREIFAKGGSNVVVTILDFVLKALSDDIALDDCEHVRVGLDKIYGDSVSPEVLEKEVRETCDRAREKAEKNEREIKEIKDRMD